MKYIDIHTHLNVSAYDQDREKTIERMHTEGVAAITVGTCRTTSERAIAIAEKNDDCYATIGVHPCDVVATDPDLGVTDSCGDGGGWNQEVFRELAMHPKVVAIGEIGFDYFHFGDGHENVSKERAVFSEQIALANEVEKPLMLHIRHKSGQRDAYADALEMLDAEAKVLGNVHFFAGNWEHAKAFFDRGYTISFTGVITFTQDYDEIIKHAPLDMIHAETDAPFVTPVPHRGKRNEPVFVTEVYKRIAAIKHMSEEDVRIQLLKNAEKMFTLA